MAFPEPADGWVLAAENQPSGLVSGSELLATRDGGAAWSCQWHGALTPEQIVASDPEHAWVLGWRGSGGCGDYLALRRCQAVIVGTSDGTRWSVLDQANQGITQLAFASAKVGLAAARNRNCEEPGGLPPARCAGQVLLTNDAGRHWRTVLRTPAPVVAVATARGTFWAVETRLGSSSKFGRKPGLLVLVSHDSGQSWTPAGTIGLRFAGLRQQVQLLVGAQGRLWLSAIDLDGCAMHGCSPDDLWRSGDGGRTWKISDPQDRAERFRMWSRWSGRAGAR